jgi:intracellular sulfur oxidation DsrE/DsrF family protein
MIARIFAPLAAALALVMALAASPVQAADAHKVVLQVNDNDKGRMNLVMNNAANLVQYYADKGEEVQIEIVAYGPGLNMLVDNAEANPVHKRAASFAGSFPNVGFRACGNTMKKFTKKAGGKAPKLVDGVEVVPAGVVHIMGRQEAGWSYVKP